MKTQAEHLSDLRLSIRVAAAHITPSKTDGDIFREATDTAIENSRNATDISRLTTQLVAAAAVAPDDWAIYYTGLRVSAWLQANDYATVSDAYRAISNYDDDSKTLANNIMGGDADYTLALICRIQGVLFGMLSDSDRAADYSKLAAMEA